MRLLVTRPEPEAGALAAELRNLGHEAVLEPLLEFSVLDFDPAPLKAADALIFTSANSLRALREKLDPSCIWSCPVFCVGSETERRAREAGFKTIAAAAETAEELAGKIVAAASKVSRLVHVTGEYQAFDLEEALTREGLSIGTLRVYGMKARKGFDPQIAGEIQEGTIGGVILMSPRTAEVFVTLCRQHGLFDNAKSLHYFCLASSVANRLKPVEPVHVHVALRPNRMALLALLPTPGQDCTI